MENKIIEIEEFIIIGMPAKLSLNDPEYKKKIVDLWDRSLPRLPTVKNRKNELFYGSCSSSDGIEGDECSFEYISGVEVISADEIPEGMKMKTIPAGKYYVGTHKGKAQTCGETYMKIEQEMKAQDLEEDRSKPFFELYDERFKEDSDDSEFDIYSPIK